MNIKVWLVAMVVVALGTLQARGALLLEAVSASGPIPGSSVMPGYEGWIEVDEFGIGFLHSGGLGGGAGAGRVTVSPLRLKAPASQASPLLLMEMVRGRVFDEVTLAFHGFYMAKPAKIAEWVLEDTILTRFNTSGDGSTMLDEFEFGDIGRLRYRYYYGKVGDDFTEMVWDFNLNTSSLTHVGDVDPSQFRLITGTLVPEPATAALAMTGGLLLLRRRRV